MRSVLRIVCVAALLAVGSVSAAPALKDRPPVPPGTWAVVYHPNRAVRVYTVSAAGEVSFPEGGTKTKLQVKDRETLLDLSDGKLERWTVGRDGRLFVEHFNPKANYPDGPPDQIGVGTLKPEDK